MDGKTIKLWIWDITPAERLKRNYLIHIKLAIGIVVIYDITDRASFSAVQHWMLEIEKHASVNVVSILVGNKCDLESQRQVTFEEGQELADHYGVRFLETSAKDSKNVEKTYALLTHEIMT